jgi:2-polyprenyl-6-methoxyphenol hydroxylase-like FAD-dependent oxidoreductase
VASLRPPQSRHRPTFQVAAYLAGCDGSRSQVRRQIGARLSGTPVIQRVQSTCIRAPQLLGMLPGKHAWMYLSLNPRRCGTVIAIDGRETWLIHNHLYEGEPEFDSIDRDWAIRTILGVGADFQYEVVSKEDWTGRRLVADRFRDRRAFIAGDAAHLGTLCRLWHECRHCRRDGPVLDARRRAEGLGAGEPA